MAIETAHTALRAALRIAIDAKDNDGLYELNEALAALCKATLDIKPVDIGRIAEFWLDLG